MPSSPINAAAAPAPSGGYAQATLLTNPERFLYISDQIPVSQSGRVPTDFTEQALLVWNNLEAQRAAAEMTLDHLVKVTIFLSDRRFADANRAVRAAVLGGRSPALTVIITGIFDPGWLLEIEAVAAA